MIQQSEFEGRDLNEALKLAAAELMVPQADLDYEIVEQGRRGVFGLGARSVRIRVVSPPDEPSQPQEEGRAAASPREGKRPPERPAVAPGPESERAEQVASTIRKILELMGLSVQVGFEIGEAGLNIEVTGPDQKLLVQKDAELLLALQFLVNRMAIRSWPDAGPIHIACEAHGRQRDDELIALAKKVASDVTRSGQARRLQPLNAYERRLVHVTIQQIGGLTSASEGEGALKRVRIAPLRQG